MSFHFRKRVLSAIGAVFLATTLATGHNVFGSYAQVTTITPEKAAEIARTKADPRGVVVYVGRSGNIFFVVINTSGRNTTYCILNNGKYLGPC